jgi:hypothetical protein
MLPDISGYQPVKMTIQAFTVGLSHVIKAYVSCMTSQINDTHAIYRTELETLHSHCYNFNKYVREVWLNFQ